MISDSDRALLKAVGKTESEWLAYSRRWQRLDIWHPMWIGRKVLTVLVAVTVCILTFPRLFDRPEIPLAIAAFVISIILTIPYAMRVTLPLSKCSADRVCFGHMIRESRHMRGGR